MIFPPRRMAPGERLTAANYNALLDYVRRITPVQGANVNVDYRACGAVISGTPGGAAPVAAVAPFTVRHHEGQWEIYLPEGCVNVGGTCAALNDAASGSGSDHQTDDAAWRILDIDESEGETGTDSDGHSYSEWTVAVHAKTSAKVYGVDELEAPARRLFWAGATDSLKSTSQMSSAERHRGTAGDTFTSNVARVRVTTVDEGDYMRSVTQLRDTPIDVGEASAPTGFDLVWYFSVSDGAIVTRKVYCLRQMAAVAGFVLEGPEMTDVTDAEDVYARIDSSDMSDRTGILSVVKDPSGADNPNTHNTLITWLPLYKLEANTVVADYRENSLKNVQLYRA